MENDVLEPMLEQRVIRLERQMSELQRLFKTATPFDENLLEHSELLRGLITECPRQSQRGLCFTARQRHELSKGRVIELLRLGIWKFWRVEAGMFNSLLYFPLANGTQSDTEQTQHTDPAKRVEQRTERKAYIPKKKWEKVLKKAAWVGRGIKIFTFLPLRRPWASAAKMVNYFQPKNGTYVQQLTDKKLIGKQACKAISDGKESQF